MIERITIIGIMRHISSVDLAPVLEQYVNAGLQDVEITMNSRDAINMIRYAAEHYGNRLRIGAGTVCSLEQLNMALEAGASFIVTPVVQLPVISTCAKQNIPVYPGALTPTEIHTAWEAGATMVKVFPAGNVGPSFIRDVKASLNTVKLLPTGGIQLSQIEAYIDAGADGVGIGSPLFDRAIIQSQNWTALRQHFEAFASKLMVAAK